MNIHSSTWVINTCSMLRSSNGSRISLPRWLASSFNVLWYRFLCTIGRRQDQNKSCRIESTKIFYNFSVNFFTSTQFPSRVRSRHCSFRLRVKLSASACLIRGDRRGELRWAIIGCFTWAVIRWDRCHFESLEEGAYLSLPIFCHFFVSFVD